MPWQMMWCVSSGAVMYRTILAIVQIRCSSSGAGSFVSGFRCNTIPTGRCSRNACCAAAIDFGRPMVMGARTPGNKTVLRTGMMIRASLGIGADSAGLAVEDDVEAGSSLAGDMTILTQTLPDAI